MDVGRPPEISRSEYEALKKEIENHNAKMKKTIEDRDDKWKNKVDEIIKKIKQDHLEELTKIEQTKTDIETRLNTVLDENKILKTQLRLYEDAQKYDKPTATSHNTPLPEDTDEDMDTTRPDKAKTNNDNTGWQSGKKRRHKNANKQDMTKKLNLTEDFPNLPKTNNPTLHQAMVKQVNASQSDRDSGSQGPEEAVKRGGDAPPGSGNSAPAEPEKAKRNRVPPIIIRDKTKFTDISKRLYQNRIDYGKAMTITEGVKLHPTSYESYRQIVEVLEATGTPFHSFRLQEEKELHVVIRGVLETWSEEKVRVDLEALGYTPSRVIRWNNKSGEPMPLVLIILPKTQTKIFDLTKLDTLSVKVESHRTKSRETQCHRCQLYGHSQYKCRAPPKCLKCAQAHMSYQCTAGPTVQMKCANCGGNHPANYRECPKHPSNIKNARNPVASASTSSPAPVGKFAWGQQDNTKLINKSNNTTNPNDLLTAINVMIQNSMQAFLQEIGKNLQTQLGTIAQSMLPTARLGN